MAMSTQNDFLDELRFHTPFAHVHAPDVSKWSIGMHIQHCAMVMNGVCRALNQSNPPAPKTKFSPVSSIIFLTGRIPRGRGRAPDVVIPSQSVTPTVLTDLLAESESWMERVSQLDPDAWFEHFAFGVLNRNKTIRFLGIHNRHHLRIVTDIADAAGAIREGPAQ